MTISQTLLPEFDQEMTNTRKLLERVPDGTFEYRPHAKSMTMGQLASHVVDMAGWLTVILDLEVFDLPADFKPFHVTSQAALLEAFNRNVKAARKKIEGATDADWAKTWTLSLGGKNILSMPRAAAARGMVLNHVIHHRAQLGVYLRLNEIAVPGMYGPSADDSAQAQAA
jgi:uncharacterized damage-inducible protein DinB